MATADVYERVGDFEINLSEKEKLGFGAYGQVFPGKNLKTGDKVAAKKGTVYKEYLDTGDFELEADLLLNKIPRHRNIVKVYDFIKKEYIKDGVEMIDLWLITELCPLGNLKVYAQQRDLSIDEKIELMYQSSLAVHHLHEGCPEPVCHRDIKPENILVAEYIYGPVIKVCDFGGAKTVVRRNEYSISMKTIGGTVGYAAPEQINEQRQRWYFWRKEISYNKNIDIYSLGISHLALLESVRGKPMKAKTDGEGKPLAELLWANRNRWFWKYEPAIDQPTDSPLEIKVKAIIKDMIKLKPSERLPIARVIQRLSKLRRLKGPKLIAINVRSAWVREGSTWKPLPDMPVDQPGADACYCTVSYGIVVVGGWYGTVSSMCHHFSLLTRCWRRLADMPTARHSASAVVLRDILLVLGGRDKYMNALAVCERFHLGDGVWSPAVPMMEPLSRPLVATAAGKVFVLPRRSIISPDTQLQQYNPSTDQFSHTTPLPQHVQTTRGACLVGAGDKLYLLGGEQRLAVQYNPASRQWSQLLSQASARYDGWEFSGVVHGGKFLLCGGLSESNAYNMVEEYDTHIEKWQIADFTLPFHFYWDNCFVGSIQI